MRLGREMGLVERPSERRRLGEPGTTSGEVPSVSFEGDAGWSASIISSRLLRLTSPSDLGESFGVSGPSVSE
eukprot:4353938-Prymnesium_polylepis.1